jgi:hypothetical protein
MVSRRIGLLSRQAIRWKVRAVRRREASGGADLLRRWTQEAKRSTRRRRGAGRWVVPPDACRPRSSEVYAQSAKVHMHVHPGGKRDRRTRNSDEQQNMTQAEIRARQDRQSISVSVSSPTGKAERQTRRRRRRSNSTWTRMV